MKNKLIVLMIVLMSFGSLMGCSNQESQSSLGSGESGPVDKKETYIALAKEIMNLPYETMTVDKFNQEIQTICVKANLSIFELISGIYEIYSVYDENKEFVGVYFEDEKMEKFFDTTLNYSS